MGIQLENRTVIYTAVSDNYDFLFPPRYNTPKLDYVVFTDNPDRSFKGWRTVAFPPEVAGLPPQLMNRYCKIFPHAVFSNVDYSVYIDGNIRVIGDLWPLVLKFVKSNAMLGLFKHRQRSNIFQEFEACKKLGKFKGREIDRTRVQLQSYQKEGMPADQPLMDNGIVFRWHRHPQLPISMSLWWEQMQRYSKRDQLGLPYVVWKNHISVETWNWSFRSENSFFEVYPHRGGWLNTLLIFILAYRHDYRLANVACNWHNRARRHFK